MRSIRLSLLLAAALPFAVSCAPKSQVDDLSKRVETLETELKTLKEKGGSAATAKADANSPEEQAAMALMKEIQTAQQAGDFASAKSKLAELQSKYPTTRAGKSAGRMAAEVNLVGTDAKPLDVEKWYQGKTDINSGKATLLLFWESWCPHCQREMPKAEPIYEQYKSKGLNVVGLTKVTKSASDETVKTFIDEKKLTFPIAKENNAAMSDAYAVTGIPAAAIVKDGKVVWRGHPARLTNEMIEGYLGS